MSRVVLVLVLAVASACGGGSKRVGNQPSWRKDTPDAPAKKSPTPSTITFAPTTTAVTRYNEPLEAPGKSALGDAVIAAVREAAVAAKVPAPVPDARLFRACAELAAVVPEDGFVGYEVVEFALQRQGIIEPSPHLLVVWADLGETDGIMEQLKPRIMEAVAKGDHARVGIGVAKREDDGRGAIVFALQPSDVVTNPIPRTLPAGGTFALDAVIESGFRDPELFITREDGTTELVKIAIGRSGGFKATIECGKHKGRQQVEITASDKSGSTVLANFPIWCAEEPPSSITVNTTHEDIEVLPADEAERRLLALVNRDRQAAGLPPVVWDDRVTAVSRAHSEDMKKTKIVAHVSPTTGSAGDRVRVAGIKTALVLENVARAYSVNEAHAGLMNSPGHRANVLSPLATHIGIGITLGDDVAGRREMFVTQVFTRVPPKVEPAQAIAIVHERISKVRPVTLATALSKVAQELSDGLAAGKSRDALWPAAKRKLDTATTGYAKVGSVVVTFADLASVDGKELVGEYKPDDIGVGVTQGPHPQIGEGAIWTVVIFAEKLPKK